MSTKQVTVCGVPFIMTIVEGGVLFSDKSGFYGVTTRYMFEYRSGLWYLQTANATFGIVPVAHIIKMHKLLEEHILKSHEADKPKQIKFRDEQ